MRTAMQVAADHIESATEPKKEAEPSTPAPENSMHSNFSKTTGEKVYDGLQFTVGKVTIMALTAGIVYFAKYGKESYGGIPNVFKKFDKWFHNLLLHNKAFPMAEKGELAQRVAGAAANTMVTFHGGNMFAPVMKSMENNQENIANYVNKRWGKHGEEEIAHERLKDKPKQTWTDILKGRLAAWAIVFTGFMAVDTLLGKHQGLNKHYFDVYEEWFGRKLAGFTKAGKELGKIPLSQPLSAAQDGNQVYRFSKALALDIYATSIAIVLWNAVSRGSAQKRQEKKTGLEAIAEMEAPVLLSGHDDESGASPTIKSFAQTVIPRTMDTALQTHSGNYAETITSQKTVASGPLLAGA